MFKKPLLVGILISITIFLVGCTTKNMEEPTVYHTKTPTATETPNVSLTPYPRGQVPGSQGWIPPLPPGMEQPRVLTEADWELVLTLSRSDPEIVKQADNDNIDNEVRFWVGYAGGPGFNNYPDSSIISGEVQPPGNHWYYPAIEFTYKTRTDRSGQIVGVDLDTKRVVFSNGWGMLPEHSLPPR